MNEQLRDDLSLNYTKYTQLCAESQAVKTDYRDDVVYLLLLVRRLMQRLSPHDNISSSSVDDMKGGNRGENNTINGTSTHQQLQATLINGTNANTRAKSKTTSPLNTSCYNRTNTNNLGTTTIQNGNDTRDMVKVQHIVSEINQQVKTLPIAQTSEQLRELCECLQLKLFNQHHCVHVVSDENVTPDNERCDLAIRTEL